MKRYLALQKIVEVGSFTRAAKELGYTQSAISQMIHSLEEEFSIKLLSRSRMGTKLTIDGLALYPLIERMIYQHQAIEEKVKEIRGLEEGIIRIGTISSVSFHWLPPLMKEFQVLYPKVQFVLHQGDYTSIETWIKTGAVDFGFVTPPAVTDLEVKIIKDGNMLAILPKEHRLASLEEITLEELVEDPFILLEEGHYNEPLEAFRSQKLVPNIKYTIHDDYAIMTMVEAGLGISILAELVLQRINFNIVSRPTNPPIHRTIAIGYKDEAYLPIASKYFIEFLLSKVEELR